MSEVIVAYQPNNSCFLFRELPDSDGIWRGMLSKDFDAFQTMRRPCSKWIIKPKGGIPKLDTPILSDEDVKDLND